MKEKKVPKKTYRFFLCHFNRKKTQLNAVKRTEYGIIFVVAVREYFLFETHDVQIQNNTYNPTYIQQDLSSWHKCATMVCNMNISF